MQNEREGKKYDECRTESDEGGEGDDGENEDGLGLHASIQDWGQTKDREICELGKMLRWSLSRRPVPWKSARGSRVMKSLGEQVGAFDVYRSAVLLPAFHNLIWR